MRQNSNTPRTQRLEEALQDMMAGEGDPTNINGQDTLPSGDPLIADWTEAAANKVQAFVAPDDWGKPIYNVDFVGGAVLLPPFNLKNMSEIVWKTMGWRFVCVRVSPDTDNNTILGVTALAVLTSNGTPI